MCFQVCWSVCALTPSWGKYEAAAWCQHCWASQKSFSMCWILASGRLRILVCINSSYFITIAYPIINLIHYLFYYYNMQCILCKYICFSNSNLDCWLCFPRKEELLFWESVYPPSKESPKAWNPGFSCTLQSEENPIGDCYLGQNWGWATKSEEHSLKRGEFVCLPILVSSFLSLTERFAWISFWFFWGSLPWNTGSWEQVLSKDIPHFSLSKILFTPFSLICLSHFPVSHWRRWLPEAWE